MHSPTRRTFIRQAACAALGTSGLISTIWDLRKLSAATSSDPTDYKALVCVFLYGGNDANNVIIPHDDTGYAAYASARGILAIPQLSILPLTFLDGDTRDFGFHPKLPELQSLFNQGKLALVANVGTLVGPITKAEYLSGARRCRLNFSLTQISRYNGKALPLITQIPDGVGELRIYSVRLTAPQTFLSPYRSPVQILSRWGTRWFHFKYLRPVTSLLPVLTEVPTPTSDCKLSKRCWPSRTTICWSKPTPIESRVRLPTPRFWPRSLR